MGHEGVGGRALRCVRLACAGLLAAATAAEAQSIFTCVANGRTYTGDRPPPECVASDIRELNRDGSVRRVIPRPPTPEEQKARAAEAKKKADEEENVLAQRRRDRSLLEAYASEQEIEAARVRAVSTGNDIVRRSQLRLERMNAERRRLQDETEFYRNRELPDHLRRGLASNEQERAAEQKIVGDAQAEIRRINERFEADKRRFRELVAQGAQAAPRSN